MWLKHDSVHSDSNKITFYRVLLHDYSSYLKNKSLCKCTSIFRSHCSVSTTCSREVRHQRTSDLWRVQRKLAAGFNAPTEGNARSQLLSSSSWLAKSTHVLARPSPHALRCPGSRSDKEPEKWGGGRARRAGTGERSQGAAKRPNTQAWEVVGHGINISRKPDFTVWLVVFFSFRNNLLFKKEHFVLDSILYTQLCAKILYLVRRKSTGFPSLHISVFPISAGWPQHLRGYGRLSSFSEAALASLDR